MFTTALTSILFVFSATSSPALANGNSTSPNVVIGGGGSSSDGDIGYYAQSSSVPWASARITIPNNPSVSSNSSETPLTCSWSMITESDNQYAQVGLIKMPGYSQSYYFFQENDANNQVYSVLDNGSNNGNGGNWNTGGATGPSIGSQVTYTIEKYTDGSLRGYVNGSSYSGIFTMTPAIEWTANKS